MDVIAHEVTRETVAPEIAAHETAEQLSHALGQAVVKMWGYLPHDLQNRLFKEAVTSANDAMKPQLAVFLHEQHPRTSAARQARAILEPDSLGG